MSKAIINVFVSHPIGGDVKRNIELVRRICGYIFMNNPYILPLVPYLLALEFLNDNDPNDRLRGIAYNRQFFEEGFVDELWLYGDRISAGMWQEIGWAREFSIPVIAMTKETQLALLRKEISTGNVIQLLGCGPSLPCEAIFHRELEHEQGILIHTGGRDHDLTWGDVIWIHPKGVPVESIKRAA